MLLRRLLRLLAPALLLAGVVAAAPASAEEDLPGRLLEHAEEVAGAGRADEARAASRHLDVVTDARGDVRALPAAGTSTAGTTRTERRHQPADLLRASYRTPERPGGTVRVAVRWADLHDDGAAGGRAQQQLTMLEHPASGATWFFWLGSRGGSARLYDLTDPLGEAVRLRPRRVDVDRVPGPRGVTVVRLSTEWLPVGRVRFHTFSQSGEAMDEVDGSRALDVARHRVASASRDTVGAMP